MGGIGLVGLGAMGASMGRNILSKTGGLHVIGTRARDTVAELVADGATDHADAAAAARAADTIVLCLPNSDAVQAVIEEMLPELSPGKLVIDTGTSALPAALALSDRLQGIDVAFAEAPLTGGAAQAEAGVLGALVGASDQTFARAAPILSLFCAEVQHFGPVGTGAKAKFINNYMVMGIAALVTEAFTAAAEEGIDWAAFYDVVMMGSARSGVLERIIGNAKDGDFSGYVFSVENAAKDMRYIAEYLEAAGRDTDLSRAVHDLFQRAETLGHGPRRISELLRPDVRDGVLDRD